MSTDSTRNTKAWWRRLHNVVLWNVWHRWRDTDGDTLKDWRW